MAYFKEKVQEIFFSILPVTLIIAFLQITVIKMPSEDFINFLVGVLFVSLGLVFFLTGANFGLLPVGEMIGAALPKSKKAWFVILFGFFLGFLVTVAEPNLRVLATQIESVAPGSISKNALVYSISIGIGLFVALAMAKIIFNLPVGRIVVFFYGIIFLLALKTPSEFLPIAMDAGGVTTGPLNVPFIIALGVGVSSVMRGRSSSGDGFGLVGLSSLGPVMAVMILGVLYL